MKLATFFAPGGDLPQAGEVRDGRVIAFTDGSTVLDRVAIDGGGVPADGESWRLDEVELLAPIPQPRGVYCIALNYPMHAAETGFQPPDRPTVFLKGPGSSNAPNGTVRKPPVVERLDYEGELVIVLGEGKVAGYAIANDVTARDLQRAERHWARAKGADEFCPWGPWVTTADEVTDPEALSLRTWVNGELRQDGNTRDLIFGVDRLVSCIAETNALKPGDLILTGTCDGIGARLDPPKFLQPGDTVRIAIEGLGEIEHRIQAG